MTRVYRKHGMSGNAGHHPIYTIWRGMLARCYQKNGTGYEYYGGKGICLCDEWKEFPLKFLEWSLSNGYVKGLTIDRIDGDGDYTPDNCRWITQTEQNKNKPLIQANNSSGYRGVSWNKQRYGDGKWLAMGSIKGKQKFLGRFDSPEEAARARDNHVIKNNLGLPLNFKGEEK